MATTARPVHVCEGCGTPNEDVLAALAARDEMVDSLREDLAEAERDLRTKRSTIKRLRREGDRALKNDPLYDKAIRVLTYWQAELAPTARDIEAGGRLENVLARLNGTYTDTELMRCADGYKLKPYVVGGRRTHEGPEDAWQADAELIFRTPRHVDAGLRIAAQADLLRSAFQPPPAQTSLPTAGTEALSALGEAAVKVARSFPIFPVQPRAKMPMTRHGLKDAKRDEQAIRTYWLRVPEANIGIRCGKEAGIVVLDVDGSKEAGEAGWESLHRLEDEHDILPTTLSVTTPRGGQHYYFAWPGFDVKNSAGLLGAGLDVRGDGGYVLAPPSVGANGREYAVDDQVRPAAMPGWLTDLIETRQRQVEHALRSGALEEFFDQGAQTGNRNDRLFRYACSEVRLKSPVHAAFVIRAVNQTYVKPPLDPKEVEQLIKSALNQKAQDGR